MSQIHDRDTTGRDLRRSRTLAGAVLAKCTVFSAALRNMSLATTSSDTTTKYPTMLSLAIIFDLVLILGSVPSASAGLLCTSGVSINVNIKCTHTNAITNYDNPEFTLSSDDIITAGKAANLKDNEIAGCGSVGAGSDFHGGTWTVTQPAVQSESAVDVKITGFTDGFGWIACGAAASGYSCVCA